MVTYAYCCNSDTLIFTMVCTHDVNCFLIVLPFLVKPMRFVNRQCSFVVDGALHVSCSLLIFVSVSLFCKYYTIWRYQKL